MIVDPRNIRDHIYYSNVIVGGWRLKSPASQMFTQLFIRVQIKENIKAPRDRWIPRTNDQ